MKALPFSSGRACLERGVATARCLPLSPHSAVTCFLAGVTCRPGLWHLAKANEPNEDFYREVAARFGGRWLVRTNLRGDPEPSSHAVLNIGELSVPSWDHAPYKARKGRGGEGKVAAVGRRK